MICYLVPQASILKQASGIRTLTVIIVIIASILAIVIGTRIANGISNTILDTIRKLDMIADGDLTVEINTKRRDEFNIMMMSITNMITHMKKIISRVHVSSKDITGYSKVIQESSGTLSQSTYKLQIAVSEIEAGIAQQSVDSMDCLMQMDSLAAKISNVNRNTDEIGSIAAKTELVIGNSMSTMHSLQNTTQSTTKITDEVISKIINLEESSSTINKILSVINSISEETNLLSLNASIEAARAGENGGGFAVVASEISKLSKQSMVASKQISLIIRDIIINTNAAVETAKEAKNIVTIQAIAVNNTVESFQSMSENVTDLRTKMIEIQENVEYMNKSKTITLEAMQSISTVMEEITHSSMSVTNIIDKQLEIATHLDGAVNLLFQDSQTLEEAVHIFILE